MTTKPKITQDLVRELLDYDPTAGTLTWRPRGKHRFKSEEAWNRWTKRYANQPAFEYVSGGYRWGSILNRNMLAHRIVWMWVHGRWPKKIKFVDSDATNLKLANMHDAITNPPKKPVRKRGRLRLTPQPRERIRLAA